MNPDCGKKADAKTRQSLKENRLEPFKRKAALDTARRACKIMP